MERFKVWPMATTDPARLQRITNAIVMKVPKEEFTFESDDEAVAWDIIKGQVESIQASGLIVDTQTE